MKTYRWWTAPTALMLIASFSGAVQATSVDLSKEGPAREFARHSDTPLAKGSAGCKDVAEYYPTLGDAFRWHERRANIENSFRCRRLGGRWTCKASFIFNDKKESEKDWALFLTFSVEDTGKVSGLNCEAAG